MGKLQKMPREPDESACFSVSCGAFGVKLQKEPREPDECRALSVSRILLRCNMAKSCSKRTTRNHSSFAKERIRESQLRSTQEVYTPPSAPQFVDNRINLNQENTNSGANLAPFPGNPFPCFFFYWGGKQAPVEQNSTDQQENDSPVDWRFP